MILILVLASAALPLMLSSRAAAKSREAAGRATLLSVLRAVRQECLRYQTRATVRIYNDLLRVDTDPQIVAPPIHAAYPLGGMVRLVADDGLPGGGIEFFPDGTSSGGRFEFGHDDQLRIIQVSALTGRAVQDVAVP